MRSLKSIIEVYLVHNFKIKLLISVDILNSEKMNISFSQQILTINNKWKTNIYVYVKDNIQIHAKVQALK